MKKRKRKISSDKVTPKDFKGQLVERELEIRASIDKSVSDIIEIVVRYKPLSLLHMAYGHMVIASLGYDAKDCIEQNIPAEPAQLLLYIQNIIASNPPSKDQTECRNESEYGRLSELFKSILSNQTVFYMCDTAKRQREGSFDKDADQIKFITQLFYNNVSGKQYQILEPEILSKLLTPHDEVMRKHFGVGAQDFVEAVKQIQTSLSKGFSNSHIELKGYFDKIKKMTEGENSGTNVSPELVQNVIKKQGWQSEINKLFGQAFRCDLFDLQKVTKLPVKLLEILSLSPDEDQEFMDKTKPYAGWPLKFYPSRLKPFLKINGRYYCFHQRNLTDNIYRTLYKIIRSVEPSYSDEWQKKQGETVEEYAFDLFAKLLPDAEIHRNLTYEWYPNKNGTKKETCETDGVVIFDDNLFIIEVRGGSFSPYSPTTDFEGFQNSISNLIGKPYTQGQRFLDYLEAHNEGAPLFDLNGNLVKKIRLPDYRRVTICCVTLEQLTDLGGRLKELKGIGTDIEITGYPIWSVSIDDLRVYVDLFQSPLVFCHYLEKRNEALTKLNDFSVFDELDHYGAYLKHNDYAMHFSEISKHAKLLPQGYRSKIDSYYSCLLHEEPMLPPQQDVPLLIKQIIGILSYQSKEGRCSIVSDLLNLAHDARIGVVEKINEGLRLQKQTGIRKIVNLSGCTNIVATFEQDGVLPNRAGNTLDIRDMALACMMNRNDSYCHLIHLKFTKNGEIYDLDHSVLTAGDITSENETRIRKISKTHANYLMQKHLNTNRNIGRNEPCPCNSGKKYKKCHGR